MENGSFYLQQGEVKSHPLSKRQTEEIVKQEDFFFPVKTLSAYVVCCKPYPNTLSPKCFMLKAGKNMLSCGTF